MKTSWVLISVVSCTIEILYCVSQLIVFIINVLEQVGNAIIRGQKYLTVPKRGPFGLENGFSYPKIVPKRDPFGKLIFEKSRQVQKTPKGRPFGLKNALRHQKY